MVHPEPEPPNPKTETPGVTASGRRKARKGDDAVRPELDSVLLASILGAYETVKARFWPSLFAQKLRGQGSGLASSSPPVCASGLRGELSAELGGTASGRRHPALSPKTEPLNLKARILNPKP